MDSRDLGSEAGPSAPFHLENGDEHYVLKMIVPTDFLKERERVVIISRHEKEHTWLHNSMSRGNIGSHLQTRLGERGKKEEVGAALQRVGSLDEERREDYNILCCVISRRGEALLSADLMHWGGCAQLWLVQTCLQVSVE